MITEDYVSFETAKLLKEKGFDAKCISYYPGSTTPTKLTFGGRVNYNNDSKWKYKMRPPISAPTIQMAMKWLREVHNIALNVCYLLGMWSYSVYRTDVSSSGFNSEDFDTYEEASEAGIKYCLENLI